MDFRKTFSFLQKGLILSLGLLVIVACTTTKTPVSSDKVEYPVFEGGSSKLAFTAQMTVKDQHEIFVYDFANKKITQLTSNRFADTSPSWSADGKYIVYSSNVNGIYQLFTMKSDGSDALA